MKGKHLGEFEEVVLLAVRQLKADATALSIKDLLRKAVHRDASLGAIYSALDRAHRKGLAVSHLGDSPADSGSRAKRFYTLTAAGESGLQETRRVRDALWADPEAVAQ